MVRKDFDLAYDLEQRGCSKDIFVETTPGEGFSRELFLTVGFSSHTVSRHSRKPDIAVEFGLHRARIKIDLGSEGEINAEKPYLSGSLALASSAAVATVSEAGTLQENSNQINAKIAMSPEASGLTSQTKNVTAGEKISVEQTIETSNVESDISVKRKPLWLFKGMEKECISGTLTREYLCTVNLRSECREYLVQSVFVIQPRDVCIHVIPDSFNDGLSLEDAKLKAHSLKVKIAHKIEEETCTEQELYKLLDQEAI